MQWLHTIAQHTHKLYNEDRNMSCSLMSSCMYNNKHVQSVDLSCYLDKFRYASTPKGVKMWVSKRPICYSLNLCIECVCQTKKESNINTLYIIHVTMFSNGFQLLTCKIKRRALFWSHCAIESSTCVTAIIHANHCTRDLMSVAWWIDQWRTTKSELVAADSRWCCVTSQNYFVEIDWIGYVWRQSWCCRFIWESWWSFA